MWISEKITSTLIFDLFIKNLRANLSNYSRV